MYAAAVPKSVIATRVAGICSLWDQSSDGAWRSAATSSAPLLGISWNRKTGLGQVVRPRAYGPRRCPPCDRRGPDTPDPGGRSAGWLPPEPTATRLADPRTAEERAYGGRPDGAEQRAGDQQHQQIGENGDVVEQECAESHPQAGGGRFGSRHRQHWSRLTAGPRRSL